MRTRPRRTSVCRVDEGRSRRRNSASGSSPPLRRQLGQNRLLLFGERGQPRLGNQHGKALHAPRIALGGSGLARNPLSCAPCAASSGSEAAVAVRSVETFTGSPDGQPLQHAPLHVLVFC